MLGSGTPVWISPTTSTPASRQVERGRQGDADDERDERTRDARCDPLEEQDPDQRTNAEDRRDRVGQREDLLAHPDQALEGRADDRRDAEQPRQLADRDRDGQADDEPGHHRDRQELREEAESRGTRDDQDDPDDESQTPRSGRCTTPGRATTGSRRRPRPTGSPPTSSRSPSDGVTSRRWHTRPAPRTRSRGRSRAACPARPA